ncbi:MAG: putative TPR repeat methyltransferase [Cocleimonas sp.]|jgi:predicted TPR repeat methyltransferase
MSGLADIYTRLGRFDEAMQLLKKCLKNQNNQEDQKTTLFSIGKLCQILDDKQTAIETYKKCLAIYPNDPTANHMLAAMTGEMVPDKPDKIYIKELFDRFSFSFDKVLENLEYKAPQHIQKVIEDLYQDTIPHSMIVIDAGCGTGLCGNF